jgi:hypothetical protein
MHDTTDYKYSERKYRYGEEDLRCKMKKLMSRVKLKPFLSKILENFYQERHAFTSLKPFLTKYLLRESNLILIRDA